MLNVKEIKLGANGPIADEISRESDNKITFQVRQKVGLIYLSGGGQNNNLFGGGLDLFTDEDREEKIYPSERVCWVEVPKSKFDSLEKFNNFLKKNKKDLFIREVFGLNPYGMRPSLRYAVDNGLTTEEDIINRYLKMKIVDGDLQPTYISYKGQQCPLYSMKQLTSIKAIGGKAEDLDYLENSLKGGLTPLFIEGDDDVESLSALDVEPASEWF